MKYNEFIQAMIGMVDDRLTEISGEQARLYDTRDFLSKLLEDSPKVKTVYTDYYTVPSRTGGPDHEVTRDSLGYFACRCEAAKNGRDCWALKGIRLAAPLGGPGLRRFMDEKYVTRQYKHSNIGFWFNK